MKVYFSVALFIAFSASPTAYAASKAETLFIDGNCNNCHTIDNQTIGPTFIEVAEKYRADPEAQSKLEKKVRIGGSGSWGVVPMPGTRSTITDEDITVLVKWILQQKAKPKAAKKAQSN